MTPRVFEQIIAHTHVPDTYVNYTTLQQKKVKKMKKNSKMSKIWWNSHFFPKKWKFWRFFNFSKNHIFDFIIFCKFIKSKNMIFRKIKKRWNFNFFFEKKCEFHQILLILEFFFIFFYFFKKGWSHRWTRADSCGRPSNSIQHILPICTTKDR